LTNIDSKAIRGERNPIPSLIIDLYVGCKTIQVGVFFSIEELVLVIYVDTGIFFMVIILFVAESAWILRAP